MTTTLNQSFRMAQTRAEHPQVDRLCKEYRKWATEDCGHPTAGRWYDCALLLAQVDFTGLSVCELGARGSFLMSYLTSVASMAVVSDNFMGWDLGGLDTWRATWEKMAEFPERLTCEIQDMQNLSYPNGRFDVVISLSAIEHIIGNGDIEAAREMGRICKPGGKVIIGTEIGHRLGGRPGSRIYDETALFERLIVPSGCKLVEPYDFSLDGADFCHKPHKPPFTSCLFVMENPEA
ncbi:hypothetical protein LCGC14_0165310 [marine sediment metagenome]|uniref:Methyltransferase type 11 domain-containing protein n=1 Tax=marine sediment metagenome TaxID=412755 RepID=A0A0F9VAV3_9ZZZZ